MRTDSSATVRFMDAKDCQNYYDDTSNGVVYGKDAQGRELVCFVEQGKDVDVIGGLLLGWIDTGVTRCVKAVGVEEDFAVDTLRKMGERKGRRVESLEDGKTPGGVSSPNSWAQGSDRMADCLQMTDSFRRLAFL